MPRRSRASPAGRQARRSERHGVVGNAGRGLGAERKRWRTEASRPAFSRGLVARERELIDRRVGNPIADCCAGSRTKGSLQAAWRTSAPGVAAMDARILSGDACPPRTRRCSGTSDRDDQRDRREQGRCDTAGCPAAIDPTDELGAVGDERRGATSQRSASRRRPSLLRQSPPSRHLLDAS